MQPEGVLDSLRSETGIDQLKQFQIILNRRLEVPRKEVDQLPQDIIITETDEFEEKTFFVPILQLLESHKTEESNQESHSYLGRIEKFIRCASIHYHDPENETITLDYWVNEATHAAFAQNFSSALDLFQSFQILLTLNLCTVSSKLKEQLYNSDSLYVNETVPSPASDERIMRFKNVFLTKEGTTEWLLSKSLSDGEHQHLHSLGLALLYRNQNCLYLLDEPETHFNPKWRSRFITSLKNCLKPNPSSVNSEVLITTHSPFLISDSHRKQVLVFDKERGKISVTRPDYNTFGASINKITMETFHKRETIGGQAEEALEEFCRRHNEGDERRGLIKEIKKTIGDSNEKTLLIKTILDSLPPNNPRRRRRLKVD